MGKNRTTSVLGTLCSRLLAVLRTHFTHLVQELLLVVKAGLLIRQTLRLVRAGPGHGHCQVGILGLGELAARSARSNTQKIRLADPGLQVTQLPNAI